MNRKNRLIRIGFGQPVMVLPAQAQTQQETLPKGYREVGSDKVAALQELCQATADTGLVLWGGVGG